MAKNLEDLIKEKAEDKFDQNFCGGFTKQDLGRPGGGSTNVFFTDEEIALGKIKQTQEYKDFKKMIIPKYIEEIQKDIVNKAGE